MLPQPMKNFNRKELWKLFKELGFKIGAEIGVFKGKHSEQLCQNIPGLRLYCIDPWSPYPFFLGRVFSPEQSLQIGDQKYESKEVMDSLCRRANRRLRQYNTIIIRKTSIDAVKDFPENYLDFVYIDGDHSYQSVMDDLVEWTKRVRVGGIISGHDYDPDWGVKKAVDDYVEMYKIKKCFYSAETRISPSFWWVKE